MATEELTAGYTPRFTVDPPVKQTGCRVIPVQGSMWTAKQLEAVKTWTTADEPEPWALTFDHVGSQFRTSARPAVSDRIPRPRGYRRGGPRARRSRVTRRAQARSPGRKPSDPDESDLVVSPGGAR
jgi:hypothetical protein